MRSYFNIKGIIYNIMVFFLLSLLIVYLVRGLLKIVLMVIRDCKKNNKD